MAKIVHKLGTSRAGERTRIWLEGERLQAIGFKWRLLFSREWSKGKLVLRIVSAKEWDALSRSDKGTVAGSTERPIIDITGAKVAETFATAEDSVNVNYEAGRIVITSKES